MVTSAGTNGRLVTDIDCTLDRRTGKFAAISAHNVIVENGVRNPDGTWQQDARRATTSATRTWSTRSAKVIADKYRTAVAPLANQVVGSITADITATADASRREPAG